MLLPVIKWAGGKRQLLPELNKKIPNQYNTYFEPFFGGGALFCDRQPVNAVINDFNPQLINVYKQIKTNPGKLMSLLLQYQTDYNSLPDDNAKTQRYFQRRDQFNQYITQNILTIESAALFIFLNKAGFNGLYRVNAKGAFNVPSAHRSSLNLFDADNINNLCSLLQSATILCGDFEKACSSAQSGDFVFFDSPYYDTFDCYQAGGFTEDDHIRLAELFKSLSDNGVYCMLTNSDTDFIKDLYKNFYIDIVPVKRMINSDSSKRTGTEIIVTNYK